MTTQTHHSLMNYSRVTPSVYVGTNACCIRHFDLKLLQKGITTDISLESERIDAPQGVKVFLWLPTRDHTAPTQQALVLAADTIHKVVQGRGKVYVHCRLGHGRAPTTVAAYLIKHRDLTPKEAEQFIKQRRPEIHLNPVQRKALQRFARAHHSHS